MKGFELLKRIRNLPKPFYTIADMEKISGLSRSSLYVALERWVKSGIMDRVAQGIYIPMGGDLAIEIAAAQLYLPNYLSFESALARYGILNLIPYTLTFATIRKTRRYILQKQEIQFRQISSKLFFGYEMKKGIHIAIPEKAFLDQVYFLCRGKTDLDLDEINLKSLSPRLLKIYAEKFPVYVQKRIDEIMGLKGR